jgi:tetratricopeptide (TPR) repeat protein
LQWIVTTNSNNLLCKKVKHHKECFSCASCGGLIDSKQNFIVCTKRSVWRLTNHQYHEHCKPCCSNNPNPNTTTRNTSATALNPFNSFVDTDSLASTTSDYELKARELYLNKNYTDAIAFYDRALSYCLNSSSSSSSSSSQDNRELFLEKECRLYNAIAQCYLHLNRVKAAIVLCCIIQGLHPRNITTIKRTAKIFSDQKMYAEARPMYELLTVMFPSNVEYEDIVNKCN